MNNDIVMTLYTHSVAGLTRGRALLDNLGLSLVSIPARALLLRLRGAVVLVQRTAVGMAPGMVRRSCGRRRLRLRLRLRL